MFFLVGLGNPGPKYRNNRHNVGFMFIDYLIEDLQIPNSNNQILNKSQTPNFKLQKKTQYQIYQLTINNHQLIVVKPLTYMNLSGRTVKSCVTRYKLHVTRDLIIIHDDLDVPLRKFKIQKGVGPKLHNGLESIEKALAQKDFWRVRIGVDNRPQGNRINGETYVLQNFSEEEKKVIKRLFPQILTRLKQILFPK